MGPANASTPTPANPQAKNGHFFLHATNSMTNAIPAMIIPELKLLAATIPAIGSVVTITSSTPLFSLIFLPICTIMEASMTISAIFTNSVG